MALMVATLTTKTILDGAGDEIQRRVLDVSGTGAGPFISEQLLGKGDGSGPINPATEEKQDAAIAAITAAAVAIGSTNGFPSARWQSGAITLTAAAQALRAAGGAGVRHVADWGVLICDAAWTANTIQISDGGTVIFAIPLPAGAGYYPLPAGLRLVSSAATALNIKAASAVTGSCVANIGGHSGAY